MAFSSFTKKRPVKVVPPKELSKVKRNFAGGLDTLTSIEELADNCSPYLRNVRNVHQGSLGMRKGPGYYSATVGESSDISQTSVTGAADQTLTTIQWLATSFTAGSTNRLVRLDVNIKQAASPIGPVIVAIYTDSSGPSSLLATSTIPASSITNAYQYLTARFIEAPKLTSGTKYWAVFYVQVVNGSGSYNISSSSTYSNTTKVSTDSGTTWPTTVNGLNIKTYMAPDGGVLGAWRVRFSNGTRMTFLAAKEAAGTTGVYSVNDNTGAVTAIKTGLSASATNYKFDFGNDFVFGVNGQDSAFKFDSTGTYSIVAGSPGSNLSTAPIDVCVHKDRLFFLDANSKITFSEAADFTTYQSTSFIYIPAPLSGDPVQAMVRLQDNLWFFTRRTKYVLYGADLSSFVLRQSTAVKGLVGPNAVWVDGNYAYFASQDGIYTCNGATDELISRSVTPDYTTNIADYSKISIVVWNNQLRVYFPESGQAANNAMLMLDLVNGGWFYDSDAYIGRVFPVKTAGDLPLLVEASSLVGRVFYAEQGYNNLGKPIAAVFYDKAENFGDPAVYKEILFCYQRFVGQTGNYPVTFGVDKELQNAPVTTAIPTQAAGALWGTAVWGSFVWGTTNFIEQTVQVNGEYRWFQYRYSLTGADTPFELQGHSTYYLIKQPR